MTRTARTVARLAAPLLVWVNSVQSGELPDFRQLVRDNRAAVVNISTGSRPRGEALGAPPESDDSRQGQLYALLERFLDQYSRPPFDPQTRSLGSGFIISADGYVLTSAHVVWQAEGVIVRLSDRSEWPAVLVGIDEPTDLALLKIDPGRTLPAVTVGDSDRLEVGAWVVAIGSPFGLEYTATQGIVSAVDRALPEANFLPFIQTDAAVNPGNSGGPLFNVDGEVVGVNTVILSQSGGYDGLAFATPINVAVNVAAQLKEHGTVTRGQLGAVLQTVDQPLAEAFGLDRPRGALVAQVFSGGAAAAAGVRPGDIVLGFDDELIEQAPRLLAMVDAVSQGRRVTASVLRGGRVITVELDINDDPGWVEPAELPADLASDALLNVAVVDLSARQRRRLGVGGRGVLVVGVEAGPAQAAGVWPNDIILSVGQHEVTGSARFAWLVRRSAAGKTVPLLVQRQGGTIYLALKIPPLGAVTDDHYSE